MLVAAPQPQPPAPSTQQLPPRWVLGAGAAAVAAAALRLVWGWYAGRTSSDMPVGDATGIPPPPPSVPRTGLEAARAAVAEAGAHLAAAGGDGAAAAAEAVGPVVLAAETGGAVDETAAMSLEQLQGMAKDLYLLIQQMELQLAELVAELSGRLPEAALDQLDGLAAQAEEVEERLASLKGQEGAEAEIAAAERAFADLQWQQFDVATVQAADTDRRSYRSLLFNLTTQRRLLRQVEAQEALRLRMRGVEARIAALLGDDGDKAEPQPAMAQPAAQRTQQAEAEGLLTGRPRPRSASPGAVAPIVGRQPVPTPAQAASAVTGELRLVAAGVSMPHPAKAATGGEDAFFISSWGQGAVGVADGVGGWAAEGVNPALYPRCLMEACEESLASQTPSEPCCPQPTCHDGGGSSAGSDAEGGSGAEGAAPAPALAVLEDAYRSTSEPGSCTAILGVLQPGGRLSVASLGDCELRVVRGGAVAHASKAQEHMWNMPLQLSCPAFYDCGSRPADAEQQQVEVQEGDVIVLGSDGLFDNLWDEQLLQAIEAEQVAGATSAHDLAEQLALRLACTAHAQSLDPAFLSPFTAELLERAGPDMGTLLPTTGGKADDVTAVVALVARA